MTRKTTHDNGSFVDPKAGSEAPTKLVWEAEVTQLIADQLDIGYSDAAGIVEAQVFFMQQSWTKGMTAKQTADKILSVSA